MPHYFIGINLALYTVQKSRLNMRRVFFSFGQISLVFLLVFGPVGFVYSGPQEQLDEQLQYHVLAAELAGQRGQAIIAAQEYLKALRLAPTAELAERATQVAAYSGDYALAFEAASQWVELEPERLEPRIVLMRVAVSLDQVDVATEHALYIVGNHPKGSAQAFRDIAQALSGDSDHGQSSVDLLNGLRQEYDEYPELEYSLALLALKYGYFEQSITAIDRALSLQDEWAEAYLLKATAIIGLDEIQRAIGLVNAADLPDEKQINLHLAFARQLLQKELGEPAIDQYLKVLELDDEQPESLYALGILQLNMGNSDAAKLYFEKLYSDVGVKMDIAAYYLGGIEESLEEYDAALEWYERVTEGDRYLDAAQRKAFVLYKLGQIAESRAWLKELRDTQPDMAIQLYMSEGELLYEAREFESAMALYNEAIELYPEELDLLYGRSLIAERLGRLTLSERDLRTILKMEPNDARSLNALGYILANHTDRYEEALELISQALLQTPEDPAVIDSMGWVQFRLGALDIALEYLTRAFDRLPDPEVAAHLGEVLWVMGRQEQAQIILEQAFQADPDNPVLRDTIKRLIQ